MKLLIVAGTPGLLSVGNTYYGGGWIASLQHYLLQKYQSSLDLSLVHFNSTYQDNIKDGCRYYCVPLAKKQFINYSKKQESYKQRLLEVVNKVCPDVILCFGTEMPFALIQEMTDIPVVLHIQGLLGPISEFLLPHAMSWKNYLMNVSRLLTYITWKKNTEREKRILASAKYLIGRTEWDKKISLMMSPQAKYFYCSEMLRPSIYNSSKIWKYIERKDKTIVSIVSSPFYKGVDVILRCAKILKEYFGKNFSWNVYGITQAKKMVELSRINPDDVNVHFEGVINSEQIIEIVCNADVFVHPSYIENSPNTVCEAQVLGIPVIATNVGGTSSIIQHNYTGILVPSNDVYLMAANIKILLTDPELSSRLGVAGRIAALERHDPDLIVAHLMEVLNKITQ